MIKDFIEEFHRYRIVGEKALRQTPDEALNQILGPDNNSVAMIVRHISGNLISRFTDFLSSDGEKPWRDRDSEFEEIEYDREAVEQMWSRGWDVLEAELAKLDETHLQFKVTIRGHPWTVHEALCRSIAHLSYHIGQMVLLARILNGAGWQWISIPKGGSREYNMNPSKERKPQ